MRKRLDAPENRREIARQPSAKNQPRRAKCPAATNATVSGARIFRDNWEVRKNDADPATVRGDEPGASAGGVFTYLKFDNIRCQIDLIFLQACC